MKTGVVVLGAIGLAIASATGTFLIGPMVTDFDVTSSGLKVTSSAMAQTHFELTRDAGRSTFEFPALAVATAVMLPGTGTDADGNEIPVTMIHYMGHVYIVTEPAAFILSEAARILNSATGAEGEGEGEPEPEPEPPLAVLYPNGGETLQIGQVVEVRWTTGEVPVSLWLHKENPERFRNIGRNLINGFKEWFVQDLPDGDDYTIKVVSETGSDFSDAPFFIVSGAGV